MSKQELCDEIMRLCGRAPVVLGPGSKEPRAVLEAAREHLLGPAPHSAASKVEILAECLASTGSQLKDDHYSTGSTITEDGLRALLAALKHVIPADLPLYESLERQWAAQQKNTADSLMEFIDNSYTASLVPGALPVSDSYATVTITVNWDECTIDILDNAGGMSALQLDAALGVGAAQSKPSATGLSGFGVGLKQAATWFSGGPAGTWSIESCVAGSNVVHIREKRPTPKNATRSLHNHSTRGRKPGARPWDDPAPEYGFTRVRITFAGETPESRKTSLYQKVSTDKDQVATYTKAIQETLEYTYARYLGGSTIARPASEGTVEWVEAKQTLSIVWVDVEHGSFSTTELKVPTLDLLPNATNPWCQISRVPHWFNLRGGYETNSPHPDNAQQNAQLWWVAKSFDIKLSHYPTVQNVCVSARIADKQGRQMGVGTNAGKALQKVQDRFSRGTRVYYNDRLICVVQAPDYLVRDAGSAQANSLLLEVDVENIEHALYGTDGANRLLTSTKNAINLTGGLSYSYMTALEAQIHHALGNGGSRTPEFLTSPRAGSPAPQRTPTFWQWAGYTKVERAKRQHAPAATPTPPAATPTPPAATPMPPSPTPTPPAATPTPPAATPMPPSPTPTPPAVNQSDFTTAEGAEVRIIPDHTGPKSTYRFEVKLSAERTWTSPELNAPDPATAKELLAGVLLSICADDNEPLNEFARSKVNELCRGQ